MSGDWQKALPEFGAKTQWVEGVILQHTHICTHTHMRVHTDTQMAAFQAKCASPLAFASFNVGKAAASQLPGHGSVCPPVKIRRQRQMLLITWPFKWSPSLTSGSISNIQLEPIKAK